MTVRNGERYLAEALRSVLDQTWPPDEIVVVDDGSTDGTPDVLREFAGDVTVLTQPPSGVAVALNRALDHATHDVIAYLDADDFWEPDAVERRLSRLQESDRPACVGGETRQFLSPELDPATAARFHVDLEPARAAVFGALLIRRDCLERVGPLDDSVLLAPAVDWIARSRRMGIATTWIDGVVLHRRIHENNSSAVSAASNYAGMFDVIRRQQRRREADRQT
jgi:glycosyltransferase involved in cell wall biosynthesis